MSALRAFVNWQPLYLDGTLDRPAWHRRAACRGLADQYLPPVPVPEGWPAAELLQRCEACPVRSECASDALGWITVAGGPLIAGGVVVRSHKSAGAGWRASLRELAAAAGGA